MSFAKFLKAFFNRRPRGDCFTLSDNGVLLVRIIIVVLGHSKSTFARNFHFLTPSPLFVPVFFTCNPPQRTFALVSYPLPHPPFLSEKVPRRL